MTLRERLERLEPRERRLLNLLVSVFVVLVLVLVPVGIVTLLGSSRSENTALREAIQAVQDGQLVVEKRRAMRQEVLQRYTKPAPALAGFLEKQAKKHGVEIPESQDRPVVPHGKQYEERSTQIVLRQVGMYNLVKFMEGIATSGHPATISRLNIRRRGVGNDSYDLQMVVSAFDRTASDKGQPSEQAEEDTEEEETGEGAGGAGAEEEAEP